MADQRRRILLVSNTVMHYRVSVYNYFHRRFAENGWEWSVLTDEIQPQNRLAPEFTIEALPFSFPAYRRRIKQINPDAVVLFLHLKDRILWPLIHWLKLTGIPVLEWTKSKNLDDPDNRLKNALFSYIHTLSDGLVLYSPEVARFLSPRLLRKAFVANNTINHEAFPPVKEGRDEIKRRFGIPFGKVVLFVGRLDVGGGRKRVDLLIEIFRDTGGRDAGLLIVGSGMKPEWSARINPATTRYLGEIHDPDNRRIAEIFSMADVCAIPGHVGLGLNQALFYGLPVVTMEGAQPPEICNLRHGRNGYMVPKDDYAQLRDRIFSLLDDDSLRARFSAAAREDFLENASIERMFSGFKACLDFVMAKKHLSSHPPPAPRGRLAPSIHE
jgi:glycosyltransferase involved in cell wall biosynthesis